MSAHPLRSLAAATWRQRYCPWALLLAGWLSQLLQTNTGLALAAPDDPVVWRFVMGGGGYSSPALAADGTIYIGAAWPDNRLYALTPNGTLQWSFPAGGGVWSSPAVGLDGMIYFTCGDGNLYALTPSGQQQWHFQSGADTLSSPAVASDSTVYFGSRDGRIYAIDRNGQQKWAWVTAGHIDGGPSLGLDGTVYCGSGDHKMYALDPGGNRRWAFYAGAPIFCCPAIGANGVVYFGTLGGQFFALNPDGTEKWRRDIGGDIFSSAAIGRNGAIYVGVGKPAACLAALNPDGSLKWSFATLTNEAFQGVYSSPAISDNGTIWFGAYDRRVYALDPAGQLKLVFETASVVFSSPTIAPGGAVCFASDDKTVYALAGPDCGGALADAPWPKFHGDAGNSGSHVAVLPRITRQPESQMVLEGQDVTLVAGATGSAALRCKWQFNGADIPGATNDSLPLVKVTLAQSGQYRLVAMDIGGSSASEPAALTVKAIPELDLVWSIRNPLGTVQDLKGVAYGKGVFVAVGAGGAILNSLDAENWWPVDSPVACTLTAVANGVDRFVAAGDGGAALVSADGRNWQVAQTYTTNGFVHLAFGNGRFVAASGGEEVAVSTNGLDWSLHRLGRNSRLSALEFGEGVFVGVASEYVWVSTYTHYIFASADGETWIQQRYEGPMMTALGYGDGRFVIFAHTGATPVVWMTSDDGTNWREVNNPQGWAALTPVAYGGGRMAGAPWGGRAPISNDRGLSWAGVSAPKSLYGSAITYGQDRFVAVGLGGAIAATVATPDGGLQWAECSRGPRYNLRAVAWGNGRYVAVGSQQIIMTSADGVHWTWNEPVTGEDRAYTGVAFGAGEFVVVGRNTPTLRSVDGVNWQALNQVVGALLNVAYCGDKFVAVGSPNVIIAWPNGGGHSHQYNPMERYVGAAYGNGLYVVIGEDGGVQLSTDARAWTELQGVWLNTQGGRIERPYPSALAYGNGRFLAKTMYGLAMSKNGSDWQVLPTSFKASCLSFVDGYFYALGSQEGRSGIGVSTDGLYWYLQDAPGGSQLAVGPGQIIAVGDLGLIREGVALRPRLVWRTGPAANDLSLEITATKVGAQYELQACTDLRDWARVLAVPGSDQTIALTDLFDPARPARFFRLFKTP